MKSLLTDRKLELFKKGMLLLLVSVFLVGWAGCSPGAGTSTEKKQTAGLQTGPAPGIGARVGFAVGAAFENVSDAELESSLADFESIGVGWLRFDISWDIVQRDGPGKFDWSVFDRIVKATNSHHIKVLPNLVFTPKWARQPACADTFKCAPKDPAQFANFTAETARHFSPMGVEAWEIWSEPNIYGQWMPAPSVDLYTDLLKQCYIRIKQVDPKATVLNGGIAPAANSKLTIDPQDFLKGMYRDGARDYMDAVNYHPYSYPALPSNTANWNSWSKMGDLPDSIRSIMIDNGDGAKKIWATEFGAPTSGPAAFAAEDLQTYEIEDAIHQLARKPWLATLFIHTYKDSGTSKSNIENFFGVLRFDGSRKPAYYALKKLLANK